MLTETDREVQRTQDKVAKGHLPTKSHLLPSLLRLLVSNSKGDQPENRCTSTHFLMFPPFLRHPQKHYRREWACREDATRVDMSIPTKGDPLQVVGLFIKGQDVMFMARTRSATKRPGWARNDLVYRSVFLGFPFSPTSDPDAEGFQGFATSDLRIKRHFSDFRIWLAFVRRPDCNTSHFSHNTAI